jgi:hypothetical protein
MKPKWTVGATVCAAGHYTGETFDGADTVPYNGVAAALDYWDEKLRPKMALTIFDGDRFSNGPTLARLRTLSKDPLLVHMVAPQEMLDARRNARGSTQNPSWAKGRETKAKNFAGLFPSAVLIDAREPADYILSRVKAVITASASVGG